MPCPCTTNTLRLFIRTVAEVDLPYSTIRTPSKQWQKTAIRSFSTTPAIRDPRSNSDSNFALNREIPFDRSPPSTQQPQTVSKSWPRGSAEGETRYASDSLADADRDSSEGRPSPSTHAGRLEGDGIAKDIKPRIRILNKTKVDPTGFKIHYSAPLAPVPARKEDDWTPPPREHWQLDKAALKTKFPEGWKPLKRLSPDALAGIRALHAQDPAQYTTEILASSFKISPEAIRRILKSKWSPDADEETDRQRRWFNRGKSIYTRHAELGQKPPKKWRDLGIGKGKPEWMVKKKWERERLPLPTLITTSRARDAKYGPRAAESLEDSLL